MYLRSTRTTFRLIPITVSLLLVVTFMSASSRCLADDRQSKESESDPESLRKALSKAESENAKQRSAWLLELRKQNQSNPWLEMENRLNIALNRVENEDEQSRAKLGFAHALLDACIDQHDDAAQKSKADALKLLRRKLSDDEWSIVGVHLNRVFSAGKELESLEAREQFGDIPIDLLWPAWELVYMSKIELARTALDVLLDGEADGTDETKKRVLLFVELKASRELRDHSLRAWSHIFDHVGPRVETSFDEARARLHYYKCEARCLATEVALKQLGVHHAAATEESTGGKNLSQMRNALSRIESEETVKRNAQLAELRNENQSDLWLGTEALLGIARAATRSRTEKAQMQLQMNFAIGLLEASVDQHSDGAQKAKADVLSHIQRKLGDVDWSIMNLLLRRVFSAKQELGALQPQVVSGLITIDYLLTAQIDAYTVRTELARAFLDAMLDDGSDEAVRAKQHVLLFVDLKAAQDLQDDSLRVWNHVYAMTRGGTESTANEALARQHYYTGEAKLLAAESALKRLGLRYASSEELRGREEFARKRKVLTDLEADETTKRRAQLDELRKQDQSDPWLEAEVHLSNLCAAARAGKKSEQMHAELAFADSYLETFIDQHDDDAQKAKADGLRLLQRRLGDDEWSIVETLFRRVFSAQKGLEAFLAQLEFGEINTEFYLRVEERVYSARVELARAVLNGMLDGASTAKRRLLLFAELRAAQETRDRALQYWAIQYALVRGGTSTAGTEARARHCFYTNEARVLTAKAELKALGDD